MKHVPVILMSMLAVVTVSSCQTSREGSKSAGGLSLTALIQPLGKNTVEGTLTARQDKQGAVTVVISVKGLTPGRHGAHIHSGASCSEDGKAAGPHWDPHTTGKHGNPDDPATVHHAADMPNLVADASGAGSMSFRTTNFKLADLTGKTVVVHEKPDNYTDTPPNGGSGARIGCGVIGSPKD